MKTTNQKTKQTKGFTLIEMIGVLAVIAILAAVLIPKVFEAINNAKVNSAAMSCQSVKTAITDHYAKYGSLTLTAPLTAPTTITSPTNNYDGYVLREGFLDKPFAVKIGNASSLTTIELDTAEALTVNPLAPVTPSVTAHVLGSASFNLDGTGTAGTDYNKATGSAVVYAVITGVSLNDARDLNARIDGTSTLLGEASGLTGASIVDASASDVSGRVKYTFTTAGTPTTVYVYLTHR